MRILWPDTVGNDEFLHVNVHEASVLEPLLQLGSGTDLVALLFERAVDFVEILLERGAVEAAVFGVGVAVPVLEFNPAAGLN